MSSEISAFVNRSKVHCGTCSRVIGVIKQWCDPSLEILLRMNELSNQSFGFLEYLNGLISEGRTDIDPETVAAEEQRIAEFNEWHRLISLPNDELNKWIISRPDLMGKWMKTYLELPWGFIKSRDGRYEIGSNVNKQTYYRDTIKHLKKLRQTQNRFLLRLSEAKATFHPRVTQEKIQRQARHLKDIEAVIEKKTNMAFSDIPPLIIEEKELPIRVRCRCQTDGGCNTLNTFAEESL